MAGWNVEKVIQDMEEDKRIKGLWEIKYQYLKQAAQRENRRPRKTYALGERCERCHKRQAIARDLCRPCYMKAYAERQRVAEVVARV